MTGYYTIQKIAALHDNFLKNKHPHNCVPTSIHSSRQKTNFQ